MHTIVISVSIYTHTQAKKKIRKLKRQHQEESSSGEESDVEEYLDHHHHDALQQHAGSDGSVNSQHMTPVCLCVPVAVCCSVSQCGAVWCSVVQCGAVWCSQFPADDHCGFVCCCCGVL